MKRMDNRNWYLKQLGIEQYQLRKPASLKGEIVVDIHHNIRLIVVAKQMPTEKIYADILAAINLTSEQVLFLMPAQLIMPIEDINTVVWFIDESLPEDWQQASQNESIQIPPIIQSGSLSQLANTPKDKRQLWYTLCQYESYFHPNDIRSV